MVMEVTNELENHINKKIKYHQKLLNNFLAVEDYLACVPHRDEIARLTKMLTPQAV
jgi:hypothetical protein